MLGGTSLSCLTTSQITVGRVQYRKGLVSQQTPDEVRVKDTGLRYFIIIIIIIIELLNIIVIVLV